MATLTAVLSTVTQTFQLPVGLLSALCFVESNHKVTAINHHDGGSPSVGVCQVKFTTAKLMGYRGTEKELTTMNLNTYYAAKYLKWQLDRYEGNITFAVAAYNAGSLKLDDKGKIKNSNYVKKVFTAWAENR